MSYRWCAKVSYDAEQGTKGPGPRTSRRSKPADLK